MFFLQKNTAELSKYIKINDHAIEVKENKQPYF